MTPDDFTVSTATGRVAIRTGGAVVGVLAWYDPTDRMWIAPLGSDAPDPTQTPPPPWLPVTIEQRTDQP